MKKASAEHLNLIFFSKAHMAHFKLGQNQLDKIPFVIVLLYYVHIHICVCIYIYTHTYIHIHIYICCVCVCVCVPWLNQISDMKHADKRTP